MKIEETEKSKKSFDESYKNLSITDPSLSFSVTDKKIYNELVCLVKNSGSIIDLGCGHGGSLRIFRKLNEKSLLTGIDFSDVVLEYAKKVMKNDRRLVLMNGDLNQFNLEKEKYDLVYCSQVLEHLSKPQRLLKQIYRSLTSGGSVVLCTVYKKKWSWYFYKNRFNERCLTNDHINEYKNVDDLLNQLRKAGFDNYHYSTVLFRFPLIDPVIRFIIGFVKNKKNHKIM